MRVKGHWLLHLRRWIRHCRDYRGQQGCSRCLRVCLDLRICLFYQWRCLFFPLVFLLLALLQRRIGLCGGHHSTRNSPWCFLYYRSLDWVLIICVLLAFLLLVCLTSRLDGVVWLTVIMGALF